MSLLVAAADESRARGLADALASAGLPVAGCTVCSAMVRESVRCAPELIVVDLGVADQAVLHELSLVQTARPTAVMLFALTFEDDWTRLADAAGIWHAAPGPCAPDAVAAAWPLVRLRAKQCREHGRALEGALARLEERKWVDRAKGVLMTAQGLTEADAFALLRTASMQTNMRVGEVSRAVYEAASAASALNRVGLLRMLSQRVVKSLALLVAGVDRAAAMASLEDSLQRGQATIDHLDKLDLPAELNPVCDAVRTSWRELRSSIDVGPRAQAPDLRAIDLLAQTLLDDAQRVTDELQQVLGRPKLQIVNLTARQRMLALRVAKEALLRSVAGKGVEATAQLDAAVSEFEAALAQIERSQLHGEEIRATLAVARAQWQRLLTATRDAPGRGARDSRVVLARESEALLESFEHLTGLVERSMQVLMS